MNYYLNYGLHNFDRCQKRKKNSWLDKTRASSQSKKTDIYLWTWLISHDDRTDIGYQQKKSPGAAVEFVYLRERPQKVFLRTKLQKF